MFDPVNLGDTPGATPRLHLRMFGGLEIVAPDGRVLGTLAAQPKRAALLVALRRR
jgi:hypothetical protein